MKKILSILICVVLGISSAWAATSTYTLTAKVQSSFTPNATNVTAKTIVCASSTAGDCNNSSYLFPKQSVTKEDHIIDGLSALGSLLLGTHTFTTTMYVCAEIESVDYVFSHWTDNDGNIIENLGREGTYSYSKSYNLRDDLFDVDGKMDWNSFKYWARYTGKNKTDQITLTAHWVQPQVTNVAVTNCEEVTNPEVPATNGKFVFSLANDITESNYTANLDDLAANNFSVSDDVYTKGSYTYYLTYRPTGVHGTYQAEMTLCSKYPTGDAANKCKTGVISVTENYQPKFTTVDVHNFGEVVKGSYRQTLDGYLSLNKANYAAEHAEWTAWITADAASQGLFAIQGEVGSDGKYHPESGEPIVRFTPTDALTDGSEYTATLHLMCTYYDAAGKPIQSVEKAITLKATPFISSESKIQFGYPKVTELNFGEVYLGTLPKKTEYVIMENILENESSPAFSWTNNEFFEYSYASGIIQLGINNNDAYCGDFTATLRVNAISSLDNTTVCTDEVMVIANVRLANPNLTAYCGIGQNTLAWEKVYGADYYIVTRNGSTILTTSDNTTTSFVDGNLADGTVCEYTVTAVYTRDNQYNTSSTATVTVGIPTVITPANDETTGLTTGTNIFKAGDATYGVRPYRQKRDIDLTNAFDDNGTPLFDQLYIFGLTTNSDATTVTVDGVTSHKITGFTTTTNSNAVTPCYVYNKSGNKYVLDTSKSVANVNVATKPASFNIDATGQKIYFTGYAPYATCGSTWEENGVFCFTGDGANIDLYLDNLQLYARYKAVNGNVAGTKSYEIKGWGDLGVVGSPEFKIDINGPSVNVYAQGSGSAFCFHPKSDFSPRIHLSGENSLESVEGMYLYMDIDFYLSFKTSTPVVQKSAPIQILHNNETSSKKTKLVIDDLWNSQRTNGSLDLASASSIRNAPTIDLGNEKTELSFEGGRIQLANSYNESTTYTVSYAISYRKYSMMGGMANMYGLGNDQPEGKVRFKDGTISCKPLSDELFQKPIGQALYHNTTSMKCPLDTKIDGGTFNSDVLVCATTTSKGTSPQNSNGDALCKYAIPVKSVSASGVATELRDNWMDYAMSIGAKTNDLGYYGISSMTPKDVIDKEGNPLKEVYLMLPSTQVCFVDLQTTPWVMCYPQLSITSDIGNTILGGEVDVPDSRSVDTEGLTTIKKTSKFLYGEMDPLYMIPNVGSYDAPGDITVSLRNEGLPEAVRNSTDYVVYDKMYMLIPLVANQWKMFVPPFDVSNVYVIESYPENKLIADFGTATTDKKGNVVKEITEESQIEQARIAQSYRMLDLFYHWVWNVDVSKSNADFWSNTKGYPAIGNYNSYGTFVQDWMDMYIVRDGAGKITNKDYMPVIEQLYHYTSDPSAVYPTGKYWWDANFYLYKATNKVVDVENDQLQMSWDEVPVVSKARNLAGNHNVIMEKGGVYVWSFPSTVVNNTMQDYTKNWDYWTGKYILIEGYPTEEFDTDGDGENDDMGQLIAGANTLTSTILTDVNLGLTNSAEMRGNYTFAKSTLAGVENAFVLNNYIRGKSIGADTDDEWGNALLDSEQSHNVYVNPYDLGFEEEIELNPGQGFILTNFTSSYGLRPRSINVKSGAVTYYDRDETTTSVPTIGGNKQMMVYNIEGGVGIVPVVAQQVSIYNAAGQLVTSQYLTDEVHIPLPSGIYLIAGANDQFKAVVK